MKIRAKTILIVAITLVGLIAVLYAASDAFVLKGFETVEKEDGRQNVERMVSALLNDINMLDSLTNEMASWNETATLLEDDALDDTWTKISDPTFERLGVNLILILDGNGEVVAGRAYDLGRTEAVSLPDDLAEHLSAGRPLLNTTAHPSGTMGILALAEQPLLIASRPVIGHSPAGESTIGTIVMGRYLDENEVTRISMITSLPVALYRYDAPDLPPDVLDARTTLSTGLPTFIERQDGDTVAGSVLTCINPLDGDTLCGYAVIGDIYGNPAFLMRLAIPRDIYAQGTISTAYFVISLLAVGFIFGVLTLLLLDRTVLSRLSFLSTTVGTIETNRDFSTRVALPGRDEIASLATDINRMLDALETAQKRLKGQLVESEERYRLFFNSGNDAVYVFCVDDARMPGRFVEVNDEACRRLGYDRESLLCRSPDGIVGRDEEEIHGKMQELLDQRHVLYETVQQTRDGACIPVEINAHLVMHEDRPIVIAIARDISERKQMDELKRQAFEQIQKNYEQFAILNDQIRNPLQVIVGLAAMDDGVLGEKILQNADVIDGIVDELDRGWIESEKVREFLKRYYG
ncbi:PAS domain S-box protein [Methanoculleus sp. FWC-SCC1]|uniref:PAS domain S-box protein n=1 Tax=Methanoculleus frigidifontis TaxID=2584085 RepID=A0ABT8MB98_9EURY|nr:CHASE4 domain-containing protein [Methanoculleus sp. FWC-SCC1]MDN7025156.1 PAS domain S-box protein [Methanoculleus sp. FWC-SCC1]